MNKTVIALCIAAALATGTIVFAQLQNPPKPDERIDKLLEQNEKILKNQDTILEKLTDMQQDLLILKRRSS